MKITEIVLCWVVYCCIVAATGGVYWWWNRRREAAFDGAVAKGLAEWRGTMDDEDRKMGPIEAAMQAGPGKGAELIKYRYLNMERKEFTRSPEELADQLGRGGYLLSIPSDGWKEVLIAGARKLFSEEDALDLCRQMDRNAAKHRPGEPCSHPGCLSHVSHPCEGCGRIAGQAAEPVKGTHEETRPDNTRFLGAYPDSFVETSLGSSCDDMAREIETLRRENRRLNKLADQLNEKVLRVLRGEFTQMCSYCGWDAPSPPGSWQALQEHIEVCEHHPIPKLKAQVKELQETLEMRTAARFYEYEAALEEAARMVESYEWSAVAMFGQPALRDLAKEIRARAKEAAPVDMGEVSDGYHTFNELYEHRHMLFIHVMLMTTCRAWRSWENSDGSKWEGQFVAGIDTPKGQITYHLPARLWSMLSHDGIETIERGEWDGHTSADVVSRLRACVETITHTVFVPEGQAGGL